MNELFEFFDKEQKGYINTKSDFNSSSQLNYLVLLKYILFEGFEELKQMKENIAISTVIKLTDFLKMFELEKVSRDQFNEIFFDFLSKLDIKETNSLVNPSKKKIEEKLTFIVYYFIFFFISY